MDIDRLEELLDRLRLVILKQRAFDDNYRNGKLWQEDIDCETAEINEELKRIGGELLDLTY